MASKPKCFCLCCEPFRVFLWDFVPPSLPCIAKWNLGGMSACIYASKHNGNMNLFLVCSCRRQSYRVFKWFLCYTRLALLCDSCCLSNRLIVANSFLSRLFHCSSEREHRRRHDRDDSERRGRHGAGRRKHSSRSPSSGSSRRRPHHTSHHRRSGRQTQRYYVDSYNKSRVSINPSSNCGAQQSGLWAVGGRRRSFSPWLRWQHKKTRIPQPPARHARAPSVPPMAHWGAMGMWVPRPPRAYPNAPGRASASPGARHVAV